MTNSKNTTAGILLTTLNAGYIHTAFGLRCLYANLGDLQGCAELLEFSIRQKPVEIVEKLLHCRPDIIGFGVYIWNVAETRQVIGILKQIAPQVTIVLGGPEVSHPPDLPAVAELADYIITGAGEISFPRLCRQLLSPGKRPAHRWIEGVSPALADLSSPYPYYSDTDLRQRVIYVEASRGCPFKCEFCLSALDKSAKPFALQAFLNDMAQLYRRGARHFKFIDRTFNLKVETGIAILEFFLQLRCSELYLHFEVIPDHLPDPLKEVIKRYPPGMLQFEVGVQSFDPQIQQRISRRQNNDRTKANLLWLRQQSNVHVHADLIAGLPGDTLENFGNSFDQLIAVNPQEIQVGILKRLRGAPINRHSEDFDMRYDSDPPYALLSSRDIDFSDMQRLGRFSRYWDLIGNSGRFVTTLPMILADRPFARFLQFSDALYALTDSTWHIGLKRLFELTFQVMTATLQVPPPEAEATLLDDYRRCGEKGRPTFGQYDAIVLGKDTVANKRQRQLLSQ